MTVLTTRAKKESVLTYSEGDANFKRIAQTKAASYTVVEGDNRDTIELTAVATVSLPDAATIVAAADTGDFEVTIKNISGVDCTIDCVSGTDTIEGLTTDYTLIDKASVTLKVNQTNNGYNIIAGGIWGSPKILLNAKVIEIGDWDMDSLANVSIAHGLTWTKIRGVSIIIRDDADSIRYQLEYSLVNSAGRYQFDSTNINIVRTGGGVFDSTDFNATSYNRGWITIQYID